MGDGESTTQFIGVLLVLAVLKLNFDEGRTMTGSNAFLLKKIAWGLLSFFDDVTAAGVILGLLRIFAGGGLANLVWIAPWLAMTMLILRSSGGHINWDQLGSKLADDAVHGFALACAVIFWKAWGYILIPNFTINF